MAVSCAAPAPRNDTRGATKPSSSFTTAATPPRRFNEATDGACGPVTWCPRGMSCRVEFVGPFDTAALGPYPGFCPRPLPHHAATWGITAHEVTSDKGYVRRHKALRLSRDSTPRELLPRGARVYDWVREHRPTLVTVLLGTNDVAVRRAKPHELVALLIAPLVQQVLWAAEDDAHVHRAGRKRAPGRASICDVVVAVGTLLPRADALAADVHAFNEALLSSTDAPLRHPCVAVAHIGTHLNASAAETADLYDGLHPAERGEAAIAHDWMSVLQLPFERELKPRRVASPEQSPDAQPSRRLSTASSAAGAPQSAEGSSD